MRNLLLSTAWVMGLYRPPDRRILEDVILPWYASPRYGAVLFVGTRFYTRRYPRIFRAGALTTVDANPGMTRYGAERHVIARVEDAASHFARGSLDAVIINGVIGWGVDSSEAVDSTLRACRTVLRDGGEMVIGINPLRAETPLLNDAPALHLFEPFVFEPLGVSSCVVTTPFPEREHAFSFWRATSLP